MAAVLASELECGRFGEDRYTAACEERAQTGIGVLVVVAVVLFAGGFLWWRHVSKRARAAGDATSPAREYTDEEQEERRAELRREYLQKLEARDPDAQEASRDWADNLGSSWRVESFVALAFLVLVGSLLVLIPLFLFLDSLAE